MKAVFIDVDGTLVPASGATPASAVKAIKAARKNGHKIFVSTGRPMAEVHNSIREIGFDGYITSGGGHVIAEETVIYSRQFTEAEISDLIRYFDEHKIDFYLETNEGIFSSKNGKDHIRKLIAPHLAGLSEAERKSNDKAAFLDLVIEGAPLVRDDINKVSFLGSDTPIAKTRERFAKQFVVMENTVPAFGANSGEVMLTGISKAAGIQMVIEHLGIDRADTMAFGDGLNDIDMLEFVACGIAMDDARDGLKAVADEITDTAEDDGIYNSFKKHGLI